MPHHHLHAVVFGYRLALSGVVNAPAPNKDALEHIHDSMSRARIASDDSRAFVLLNGNGSPTNRTPLTINTGGKFARDFVDAFGTLSRAFASGLAG